MFEILFRVTPGYSWKMNNNGIYYFVLCPHMIIPDDLALVLTICLVALNDFDIFGVLFFVGYEKLLRI